ncbi:MAG TPA: PIN domain nuclease [Acidimicrobiia bacterium]|nr:PIN domain nuclease [Acidimicrobiia bacterium]
MILVDTSAWVEYLRATGSPADRRLAGMVGRKPFAVTDVIVAELTAGARSDADARRIRRIADSGTFYAVRPLFDYETAADVYRACRRAGAAPRSLTDCLIAAVAINNDLEVLAVGRDLETIAEHSPLRLATLTA